MKVDIKKLPRGQAELTIELSVDEYQPFLKLAAQKISESKNIPGFRPGKANFELIVKHVGKAEVWQQALERAIIKTLVRALDEQKLATVGQPHVDVLKLAPDNPVVYKATVSLLPSVTLGDLSKITVEKKEVGVGEDRIEKALADLQKMHAGQTPVERPIKHSDKVEVDFEISLDRVMLEHGKQQKFPLVIGEGSFVSGFEEQIIGLKKNEEKRFPLNFPQDYHQKTLAGKTADIKLKVHNVYQLNLPELNDSFAQSLGNFTTIQQVKDEIRQNLQADASRRESQRIEEEIIEQIINQSRFDNIPELLINAESQKMIKELKASLAQQGVNFDQYLEHLKKTHEQLLLEFVPHAIKRVKSSLVLRKVGEEAGITVSDEEIKQETNHLLRTYAHDQRAQEQITTASYQNYIRNVIASKKIIKHLKEKMVK